jgi:hypothetical protein
MKSNGPNADIFYHCVEMQEVQWDWQRMSIFDALSVSDCVAEMIASEPHHEHEEMRSFCM